jgi:hypothetical protein
MTRLLPLALVLTFAGAARADDRPKIAVLGLEVSGQIDSTGTTLARNLTIELRAKVKSSPKYVIPPNSQKDLFDEKLATGCETELAACMAQIAKKYNAAWLLYGTITNKAKDGTPGYQFSLHLLDVEKRVATPWSEWVPLADTAVSTALSSWAAKGWNGVSGQEDVVVVPDIPKKPGGEKRGDASWRTKGYIAAGGTVLLGGAFVYSWRKLDGTNYGKLCFEQPNGGKTQGPDGCGYGTRLQVTTYVAGIGAGVVGGIMIYALYKGFVSKQEHADQGVVGKSQRKRESRFVVTPVVSPDGAGATVRFDW